MSRLLLTAACVAVVAPAAAAGAQPGIERVLVNGSPSESPGLYAELLGPLRTTTPPPAGTPHAELRLVTGTGTETVRYYPTVDVLRRPGEWVAVPPELADGIESDLASVRKADGGASLPALAASALLVLGLGGVVWMTIVRRRRPAAG